MKLYDLVNNVTVQSNIELRVFNEDGEQKDTFFFNYCEDLSSQDIEEYEDYEVTYIYAETFVEKHWTHDKTRPLLVVEVQET